MSRREKQEEFAVNLAKLIIWLNENGYTVTIGEVERSKEQQHIHVRNGKSKTLKSLHLKKLAADLNVFKDGKLLSEKEEFEVIANKWSSLSEYNESGFNWGWDFRHFQRNEDVISRYSIKKEK